MLYASPHPEFHPSHRIRSTFCTTVLNPSLRSYCSKIFTINCFFSSDMSLSLIFSDMSFPIAESFLAEKSGTRIQNWLHELCFVKLRYLSCVYIFMICCVHYKNIFMICCVHNKMISLKSSLGIWQGWNLLQSSGSHQQLHNHDCHYHHPAPNKSLFFWKD